MTRKQDLQDSLARVKERIDAATADAGRAPDSVTLLPVTKYHPVADIRALHELGITAVGENREQEARAKQADFPAMDFHMIGQIQTKKANAVARWASAVHSVDSVRLAEALDRGVGLALERGDRNAGVFPCFIQLSLDGDTARGGVSTMELMQVAEAIESATHLDLAGLMCVPPIGWETEKSFSQARGVLAGMEQYFDRSLEFSAGMSGDLAEAIRHGSTIVRVGTEILGPRPLP